MVVWTVGGAGRNTHGTDKVEAFHKEFWSPAEYAEHEREALGLSPLPLAALNSAEQWQRGG